MSGVNPMSTSNPRINVTFEKEIATTLAHLAKFENKSISRLVKELALEALDKREDRYLSRIAEELDQPGVKVVSHNDAWK